jgi:hypothetical protein
MLRDTPAGIAGSARAELAAWRSADKYVRQPRGLELIPN